MSRADDLCQPAFRSARLGSNSSAALTAPERRTIHSYPKIIDMKVKFPTIFAVLVLLGFAPVLSACNTTAGAGRDIAATGNVITDEANKHKPR